MTFFQYNVNNVSKDIKNLKAFDYLTSEKGENSFPVMINLSKKPCTCG